ncbi:MAG: YbaK/EbsC family protein [Phycisphaerales bacterium]|nr:YbaK/EbsC family protein [Phycisphaerales bacterium]
MKLEPFLKERGVAFEKTGHRATYTSQTMAQAEHVTGYMVAKPVIVKGDTGYAMCVVAAPDHVDLKQVGKVLKDAHVRLAGEKEMAGLFPDCELGAEPPVGAMFGMKTIMDTGLRLDEFLVMQAGSHTEAVRIRRDDWEKLCEPVVAPISLA